MRLFNFICILKNAEEITINLEDSLFEAGCSDALVSYRNGDIYLEFDREAESIEQAVISALQQFKAAHANYNGLTFEFKNFDKIFGNDVLKGI